MSDPVALGSTYADDAFQNARAGSAAANLAAIVGASVIPGASVNPVPFTATTGGVVIGGLTALAPNTVLNSAVGVFSASLVCSLAGAGTFSFTAQQFNGGALAGGTLAGTSFRWSSATSGAGLVTMTGGVGQAGLGGVSSYQLAAGNIAFWTFNITGNIVAPTGTTINIPLVFAVGTGTVAVSNCVLTGSIVFLA